MARKPKGGRYAVTGPSLEGVSYEDVGPALSRSVTAAAAASDEGTWYVRDIDGTVLGYSERHEGGTVTTVLH